MMTWMDISQLARAIWPLWMILAFLGIAIYAFWPRNKSRFEQHARIPFIDDGEEPTRHD